METETPDSPTEKDLTGKPGTSQRSGGTEKVEIKEEQRKKTKSTVVRGQRGNAQVPEGAVRLVFKDQLQPLPKILDLKSFESFPTREREVSVSGEEHCF